MESTGLVPERVLSHLAGINSSTTTACPDDECPPARSSSGELLACKGDGHGKSLADEDVKDLEGQLGWLTECLHQYHAGSASATTAASPDPCQASPRQPRSQQQPEQQLQPAQAHVKAVRASPAAIHSTSAVPKRSKPGLSGPPLDHLDSYLQGATHTFRLALLGLSMLHQTGFTKHSKFMSGQPAVKM